MAAGDADAGLSSISRATISARLMTGRPRRPASFSSGLSAVAAEVVTTRSTSPTLAASWGPMCPPPRPTTASVSVRGVRPQVGARYSHAARKQDAPDGRHVHAANPHQVHALRDVTARASFAIRHRRRTSLLARAISTTQAARGRSARRRAFASAPVAVAHARREADGRRCDAAPRRRS